MGLTPTEIEKRGVFIETKDKEDMLIQGRVFTVYDLNIILSNLC